MNASFFALALLFVFSTTQAQKAPKVWSVGFRLAGGAASFLDQKAQKQFKPKACFSGSLLFEKGGRYFFNRSELAFENQGAYDQKHGLPISLNYLAFSQSIGFGPKRPYTYYLLGLNAGFLLNKEVGSFIQGYDYTVKAFDLSAVLGFEHRLLDHYALYLSMRFKYGLLSIYDNYDAVVQLSSRDSKRTTNVKGDLGLVFKIR